jgi:hypothetical protein
VPRGRPANEFFLIRHGQVALEIAARAARRSCLPPLGEGEIVGASWLVPPYRWRFDARAVELTRARSASMPSACATSARPIIISATTMMKRFLPVLVQRLAGETRCRSSMSTGSAASERGAADPMRSAAVSRRRVRRELGRHRDARACPAAGGAPDFLPGQFNMLYAFGVGEVAISISGDPAAPAAGVHTVRNVGAVSGAIAKLGRGDGRRARTVRHGWPVASRQGQRRGVRRRRPRPGAAAPGDLPGARQRARYGRVVLLYGTRSPPDILFGTSWSAGGALDVDSRRSPSTAPTPPGAAMSAW